jgi:hypothetical protein
VNGDGKSREAECASAGQPVPVETGRGLSVQYRDRHLYSRFDPSKHILARISALVIQPETIVLCASPLLGYGLEEILAKLPTTSLALAVEHDEALMSFSLAHIDRAVIAHERFRYVRASAPEAVVAYIDELEAGPFRRCLRIDLSGGSAVNDDFYATTTSLIDDYISRYWRNRITLIKLGRNYARNFFRNISSLAKTELLSSGSCNQPILVAGAGPSLEQTLPFIQAQRERLFLLAVDTALPVLHDSGITPDAVVLVESQYWIEKAFIGFADSRIPVIADLTARPGAVRATSGPIRFFHTKYANARFLGRFADSCETPVSVPPLGSVGLTAIYLARELAAPGLPIFFTGLDFSWGKGFTHARGAPATTAIYESAHRITPASQSCADRAFSPGAFSREGKCGAVCTDPSLSGYAELCARAFKDDTRIFDIGGEGLVTGCARMTESDAGRLMREIENDCASEVGTLRYGIEASSCGQQNAREDVVRFLENERKNLSLLRDMLTGAIDADKNTRATIESLVREMDYLFLHFPDGHKGYTDSPAFLNRIRIEIDYFLKTLNHTT